MGNEGERRKMEEGEVSEWETDRWRDRVIGKLRFCGSVTKRRRGGRTKQGEFL